MLLAALVAPFTIAATPVAEPSVVRPASWPETKWVLLGRATQKNFGPDQENPSTVRTSTDRWELTLKPAANGEDIEAVVTRIVLRVDSPFGPILADTADPTNAANATKESGPDIGAAMAEMQLKPIVGKPFTLDFDNRGAFVGVTGIPKPKDSRPGPASRFSDPVRAAMFFQQVMPSEVDRLAKSSDKWSTERDLGSEIFGKAIPQIPKLPLEWTSQKTDGVCEVSWKGDLDSETPMNSITGRPAKIGMGVQGRGRWDAATFQPLEVTIVERTMMKTDLGEDKPVRIEGGSEVRFVRSEHAPAATAEAEWPQTSEPPAEAAPKPAPAAPVTPGK